MAGPWFVRSLAAGAGTGADWANAFTTRAAADTASTVGGGELFWIADDHAETGAVGITLASKGTVANLNFYYDADHTVASPGTGDLKTTGAISVTATSDINIRGAFYIYGITFNAGDAANRGRIFLQNGSAASVSQKFDNCKLALNNSNAASLVTIGVANSNVVQYFRFNNTTITFGNASQGIAVVGGIFEWVNTPSALVGTIPTTLFFGNQALYATVRVEGVDLSAAGAGKTLVGALPCGDYSFVRCKLGASVTLAATPTGPSGRVDFIQCDNGATNYFQARFRYEGTLMQETTIVRSGGASDGTTLLSWKLVSTANSKWVLPFESFPIAIWNDTVGSPVTATICGIWGGGAVPNNDDIWMEVEYLGSTLTPQASFANNTKANNLATGSALPSDSSTWGGSTTKFKMAVTFTPQMKGYIYVRVYVAAVSQTFYVDPLVVLS